MPKQTVIGIKGWRKVYITLRGKSLVEKIDIVTIADDSFKLGLAVMLKSLMMHHKTSEKIVVHVLYKFFSEKNKEKIMQSLNYPNIEINWIDTNKVPQVQRIAKFKRSFLKIN